MAPEMAVSRKGRDVIPPVFLNYTFFGKVRVRLFLLLFRVLAVTLKSFLAPFAFLRKVVLGCKVDLPSEESARKCNLSNFFHWLSRND